MNTIDIAIDEKQLSVTFSGGIDKQNVRLLISEFERGFDYYQFKEVTLKLNSPGGEYEAMRKLMDFIEVRETRNNRVCIHATDLCASAAALVLANGKWGTRIVEKDTRLLFHWIRAQFQEGQTLTSDVAAHLAKGLSNIDQDTLVRLVQTMSAGVGSVQKLLSTIESRLESLQDNWEAISLQLHRDARPSVNNQVLWVKDLQRNIKRWNSAESDKKRIHAVVMYLMARFEKDSVMDLREAYVLCLIDKIRGVLTEQEVTLGDGRMREGEIDSSQKVSNRNLANLQRGIDGVPSFSVQ